MEMVKKILFTTMKFFNRNPVGRIFTRFSKDQMILDLMVFPVIETIVNGCLRGIFVVISVAIINPYTLIPFAISAVLMFIYFKHTSVVL